MNMANTEPSTLGLCRYIVRIPSAALPNGPVTSDIRNTTSAIEASDIFALAASLATGLIFGVAPARRAVRTEPHGALRGMAAGNAHRPWAARDLLLAVQVASEIREIPDRCGRVRRRSHGRGSLKIAPDAVKGADRRAA